MEHWSVFPTETRRFKHSSSVLLIFWLKTKTWEAHVFHDHTAIPENEKRCIVCGNIKPLSDYFRDEWIICNACDSYTRQCMGIIFYTAWVDSRILILKTCPGPRGKSMEESRYIVDKCRGRAKESARRRRARLLSAEINDFTQDQWKAILEKYEYHCVYCGKTQAQLRSPLEQDHIIPLSRGGNHTASNIVPACRSCNARKSKRTPEEAKMPIRR